MFPILPRSPESLSSSLICSRSTIPKKKKKNDIFLGMSISSLQILRIERIKMNSKMSPRQCKKSLKKMGLNSILILTKKGAVLKDGLIHWVLKQNCTYLEIGCAFGTHYCLVRNFLFVTMSRKVRVL